MSSQVGLVSRKNPVNQSVGHDQNSFVFLANLPVQVFKLLSSIRGLIPVFLHAQQIVGYLVRSHPTDVVLVILTVGINQM